MSSSRAQITSIAFLVTGNLIGAGILGLPINTGLTGFIPSLVIMLIVAAAMFFSAYVLGQEACEEKISSFNLPSFYEKYLGQAGKWIATAANLVILYGLLTAYISGASAITGELLKSIMPPFLIMLINAAIMTGITIGGIELVKKCNALLMILMWGAFLLISGMAEKEIQISRYFHFHWTYALATVPIMVTSFHFHNIIPDICKDMKWQLKNILVAMGIGMVIGFFMNFLWMQVGIGALPLEGANSIDSAFTNNQPATIPLSAVLGSKLFSVSAMLFALVAITTSFIANGTGIMGFINDILCNSIKVGEGTRKGLIPALAFLPPLLIAFTWPDIFLKAINIAGGFGIVTLFGILPSIVSIRKAKTPLIKILSYVMLVMFVIFLCFEIAQEAGFLVISAEKESIP